MSIHLRQVPVLVEMDTGHRMPESVDITLHMARSYPSLLPSDYEEEIKRRLSQLHSINFFSLTFSGQHHVPQSWMKVLNRQLEETISQRYRKAIERKMKRWVIFIADALE